MIGISKTLTVSWRSSTNIFKCIYRNVIYERARFNKRDQFDGRRVHNCSLLSSQNVCIQRAARRDAARQTCRRNSRMSEKLQLQADLMLESTKKSIRQRKAVKEQWQELHGESRKGHAVMEDVTRRSTNKPLCDKGGGSSQNSRAKPQTCVLGVGEGNTLVVRNAQ